MYLFTVVSVCRNEEKGFNIICLDAECGNVLPDNFTSKFLFFKPISFISSPFCYIYGHNNFYFIITFGSLSIRSAMNGCLTNNIHVNNIFFWIKNIFSPRNANFFSLAYLSHIPKCRQKGKTY